MGADTKIEWTDATWNPLRATAQGKVSRGWACVKVSPGCANCYAESMNRRFGPGQDYTREGLRAVKPHVDVVELEKPLRWRKPRRVFVCSMTDLFGDWVTDHEILRVFSTMAAAKQHTFQVLTKRAERMQEFCTALNERSRRPIAWSQWPLPNVWMGVSAEDQPCADERIEQLQSTPAAVRWLSLEPLLGPIKLRVSCPPVFRPILRSDRVGWVVVGGESGPLARPCEVSWARSIVRQCREASVPCFVKQLGRFVVDRNDAGFDAESETYADGPDEGLPTDECAWPTPVDVEHNLSGYRDGYQGAPVRVHLHDLKGGDPSEWPMVLRVREWPKT